MCYTILRKREEDTEMTNWYLNPELHDEDYAELAELLAEEDPESSGSFYLLANFSTLVR